MNHITWSIVRCDAAQEHIGHAQGREVWQQWQMVRHRVWHQCPQHQGPLRRDRTTRRAPFWGRNFCRKWRRSRRVARWDQCCCCPSLQCRRTRTRSFCSAVLAVVADCLSCSRSDWRAVDHTTVWHLTARTTCRAGTLDNMFANYRWLCRAVRLK